MQMNRYADIDTIKKHILAVCVSAKFGHGLFTTTKALDLAIKDIPTINIKEYADKDQAYMEGYAKGVAQGGLLTGYGLGCKTWTKKENTPSVVSTTEKAVESELIEGVQTQVIEFPDTHQKFVFARKIETDGDCIKICDWEYKGVQDGERIEE